MSKSSLDCCGNIRAPPHPKEMGTPRCNEVEFESPEIKPRITERYICAYVRIV